MYTLDFSDDIIDDHFLNVRAGVCKCGYKYQGTNSHKQDQKVKAFFWCSDPITTYGTIASALTGRERVWGSNSVGVGKREPFCLRY